MARILQEDINKILEISIRHKRNCANKKYLLTDLDCIRMLCLEILKDDAVHAEEVK